MRSACVAPAVTIVAGVCTEGLETTAEMLSKESPSGRVSNLERDSRELRTA